MYSSAMETKQELYILAAEVRHVDESSKTIERQMETLQRDTRRKLRTKIVQAVIESGILGDRVDYNAKYPEAVAHTTNPENHTDVHEVYGRDPRTLFLRGGVLFNYQERDVIDALYRLHGV